MALEMNTLGDTILRQRVVAQIEAAREGLELEAGTNTSEEMENILYSNAKSREEYMELIAFLMLDLKKRPIKRNKEPEQTRETPHCNEATSEGAARSEDATSEGATSEGATSS